MKCQEDQILGQNCSSAGISYMHQNSNSSDELAGLSNSAKTPVFVDQLLMSPLFNSFLPSSGSNSANTAFSQFAAAILNKTPSPVIDLKNKKNRATPKTGVINALKFESKGSSSSGAQTPRSDEDDADAEVDELGPGRNSSPPPPPPIVATRPSPSPSKLSQFYPYTGHVMHRPIPIVQKSDSSGLNSLINSFNEKKTIDPHNKLPIVDLNDLIKINTQQQFISNLRNNSLNSNSPLMFNGNNGIISSRGFFKR